MYFKISSKDGAKFCRLLSKTFRSLLFELLRYYILTAVTKISSDTVLSGTLHSITSQRSLGFILVCFIHRKLTLR
jgi:hypothetical protein